MEKLLRRSILNRNQLVNRKRRESAKDVRKAWRDYNRVKNMQATELNRIVKDERIARREDWMLGPLAPKRDSGMRKNTYGAVDNILAQGPELPRGEQRGPRGRGSDRTGSEDTKIPGFEDGEWKGSGLRGNLMVGDRVVVIRGRPGVKGKIGEVIRLEEKADILFIKGVNKVDMRVPPQALHRARGTQIFEQELPVHIDDVRLVASLMDQTTGSLKDYIVRDVYGGAPYLERDFGSSKPRHTRYIQGNNPPTEIPWPKEDLDRSYAHTGDTLRNDVEEVTYQPSLGQLPLFTGVIDELKGRHVRTRRNMDDLNLMKRKLLEDARRDWFAERSKVLSEPFWTKEYMARVRREQEAKRVKESREAVA